MASPMSLWATLLVLFGGFLRVVLSAPVSFEIRAGDLDLYEVCGSTACISGNATVDPATNLCVCPRWPNESNTHPCDFLDCPYGKTPAYSFATNQCSCETVCSMQDCPGEEISIYSWAVDGCTCVLDCGSSLKCGPNTRADYDYETRTCVCEIIPVEERNWAKFHEYLEADFQARQIREANERLYARQITADVFVDNSTVVTALNTAATPTATSSPIPGADSNGTGAGNFTFIPPPKVDVTSALIQQALSEQPQATALIVGAVTHFFDGKITYYIQLAGLLATTLPMNASTTISCGTIGNDPEPGLVIVPTTIIQGTPQVSLTSCLIIAVNIYHSGYITYWVQLNNGTLLSLLSDNRVHDISLINQNAPSSLTILTTPLQEHKKRGLEVVTPIMIFAVDQLGKRSIEGIDPYTAHMKEETCKSMTCNNNGGKVPFWNPFQRTCYCQTEEYVMIDPSGESAPTSK